MASNDITILPTCTNKNNPEYEITYAMYSWFNTNTGETYEVYYQYTGNEWFFETYADLFKPINTSETTTLKYTVAGSGIINTLESKIYFPSIKFQFRESSVLFEVDSARSGKYKDIRAVLMVFNGLITPCNRKLRIIMSNNPLGEVITEEENDINYLLSLGSWTGKYRGEITFDPLYVSLFPDYIYDYNNEDEDEDEDEYYSDDDDYSDEEEDENENE